MKSRFLPPAVSIWIMVLLLAACARPGIVSPFSTDSTSDQPFAWRVSPPEEQGMNARLLKQMEEHVREKKLNLHSLLVIRNGVIVWETYFAPYDAETLHVQYSVTKSVASTLVGIAVDAGLISGVEQPVGEIFPGRSFANPDPHKEAIRLEDVLTMTSGLDWREGDPYITSMYRSEDGLEWLMDLPMAAEPGDRFSYCTGCSHLLTAAVAQASGQDALDFADQRLFQPLGITNYRWQRDAQGIPVGGWGLELAPRDMAKLGLLYLHGGQWQGRQIVSPSWVEAATVKRAGTGGRLGYGYQWWTYDTHGAYLALGRGGQTIFVAPDLNLIFVNTADLNTGHDPIFELIDNFVLPAVVE